MSRNPKTLKEWQEKNRDRIREQQRAFYHRNKDKYNTPEKKAYLKAWREKNGGQTREYAREWYATHKEQVSLQRAEKRVEKYGPAKVRTKMPPEEIRRRSVITARRSQERRILLYWTLKCKFKCARCDETDPACLEFHHRDPSTKTMNIGHEGKCASAERMLEEILLCDVICANCHRKHHYEERGGFSIKLLTPEEIDEITGKANVLYDNYVRHFVNSEEE